MATRPNPYVKKDPGDIMLAADWNEMQVQSREELHRHGHSGGDDSPPIARAGIAPGAVDGSRIDPQSDVALKSLKVNGRTVLDEIDRLMASVAGLAGSKVDRAGDTIGGNLAVQKDFSAASARINGPLNVAGLSTLAGALTMTGALSVNGDVTFRSKQIRLGLDANGGGQLVLANNPNDNRIYLEAFNQAGNGSAAEMLLTGFQSQPMPQLTFAAANTTVNGSLTVKGPLALGFTSADADEWPNFTWCRDLAGNWDEGLIKHSSARGAFARSGFGVHMHESREWGLWSTGWKALFAVQGGTGDAKVLGTLRAGALTIDAGVADHVVTDGSFYRWQGQVYLNVDDNLYIKDSTKGIRMHFDTVNGVFKTDVLRLGDKFRLSGVGEAMGNDDWLRMTAAGNSAVYYGGIAAGRLWTQQGVLAGSDLSLKHGVETIAGALAKVGALRGVTFSWNAAPQSGEQAGLVAQEVEAVFPQVVAAGPDGVKGVNYNGLIGLLIEAVKEQQLMIEALRLAVDRGAPA